MNRRRHHRKSRPPVDARRASDVCRWHHGYSFWPLHLPFEGSGLGSHEALGRWLFLWFARNIRLIVFRVTHPVGIVVRLAELFRIAAATVAVAVLDAWTGVGTADRAISAAIGVALGAIHLHVVARGVVHFDEWSQTATYKFIGSAFLIEKAPGLQGTTVGTVALIGPESTWRTF